MGKVKKHNLENWFECLDCNTIYTLHSKLTTRSFCPKCGENVNTLRISKPNLSARATYIPWKDSEIEVLKKVINGEILNYQAAILLDRSRNSVFRRIQRLKREMEKDANN